MKKCDNTQRYMNPGTGNCDKYGCNCENTLKSKDINQEQLDFNMEIDELCRKAVNKFGTEKQVVIAIEEANELGTELARLLRGTGDVNAVMEELADVDIMVTQLIVMAGNSGYDYESTLRKKVDHLRSLVAE